MIQFKENPWTDGQKDRRWTEGQKMNRRTEDEQKDRQTLFYRTILATAMGPKRQYSKIWPFL